MTDHAAEIRNPASPDDCARPNPTCESARTAVTAHHPREAPDRSEASRGRVLAGTPARLRLTAAICRNSQPASGSLAQRPYGVTKPRRQPVNQRVQAPIIAGHLMCPNLKLG